MFAELIRKDVTGFVGEAWLFKVGPSTTESGEGYSYLIASAATVAGAGYSEVMLFAATSRGSVADWDEIDARRHTTDIMDAMGTMGYTVYTTGDTAY